MYELDLIQLIITVYQARGTNKTSQVTKFPSVANLMWLRTIYNLSEYFFSFEKATKTT